MFCTECGKEIPNDSYICPNCGASVGQAQQPAEQNQNAQQPAYSAPSPSKKSLTALISMIFAIIAISLWLIVQILGWTHATYVFGVYILSVLLGFVQVGLMWSSFTMSILNAKKMKNMSNKNQALAALIISCITVGAYFITFIIGLAQLGMLY